MSDQPKDVTEFLAAGVTDAALLASIRDLPDTALPQGGPGDPDPPPLTEADRPDLEAEAREVFRATQEALAEGDIPAWATLEEDFYAYMESSDYLFLPTRGLWPASRVNARFKPIDTGRKDEKGKPVPISPALWLSQNRPVEQMTWAPGEPAIIENRLIADGGWVARPGCRCLNLYRPPTILPGDAALAGPWLDHVRLLYPDHADHIIRWLAQRVQQPGVKVNHALVLGGKQGIGKDTLLEPVKSAVGPWNCQEVTPMQVLGRFNGFLKSVILRMSEARDLGESDRFALYDHMKATTAAPPDVLRCDEKHLREHSVPNVCGVIITTNHKSDGIHLPADDRRHYVAWSDLEKESFPGDYWQGLYGWYAAGGLRHVAAYLAALDLTGFDPKAPPPKTAAFFDIVNANRAPEEAELSDALDGLGNPLTTTLTELANAADMRGPGSGGWIRDRKNARQIPHRLESVGYTPVRNTAAKDGLWKLGGIRQVVYAQEGLPLRDRLIAVQLRIEASR